MEKISIGRIIKEPKKVPFPKPTPKLKPPVDISKGPRTIQIQIQKQIQKQFPRVRPAEAALKPPIARVRFKEAPAFREFEKLKVQALIRPREIIKVIPAFRQFRDFRILTRAAQKAGIRERERLRQRLIIKPVYSIKELSRVGQITRLAEITKPITITKKAEAIRIARAIKVAQAIKPITLTKIITKPKPPPRLPFIFPFGTTSLLTGKDITQGYDVYVKRAKVKKGKPQFHKSNPFPLSERNALSLGSRVVDNSAARTFEPRKTSKPIEEKLINDNYWFRFQPKSYRKKKAIIEKTQYAIDSPGELKEITA